MRRSTICFLVVALLIANEVCFQVNLVRAVPQPKEKSIPLVTIIVYQKLGAEYGTFIQRGRSMEEFIGEAEGIKEGLPTFRFRQMESGKLPELPNIDVPFGLDFSRTDLTDTDLHRLENLKNLTILSLSDTKITDNGLRELQGLKNLQSLRLYRTKITDAGLKELRELKNLSELNLTETLITDVGLKELKPLQNLVTLNLQGTKVTDEGIKELRHFKNLSTLYLPGEAFTDTTLKELRRIGLLHALGKAFAKDNKRPHHSEEVVELDLSFNEISDKGLQELKEFTQLSELHLGKRITDAGLRELKDFKHLSTLAIRHTQITPEGLKELQNLPNLTKLMLSETQSTESWLKELQNLKTVSELDYSHYVTDITLQNLRKFGLLHLWSGARTKEGKRPRNPDEVVFCNLSFTKTTDASLKELQAFKNLSRINLPNPLTDATLKELGRIGLLHTLGDGQDGKLPKSADEVVTLSPYSSYGSQVTNAGLKELQVFKNLSTLYFPIEKVTDATLKELRSIGLLHALNLASAEGKKRPRNSDEVVNFRLSSTRVTDAGLQELQGFKNLRNLDLDYRRITDTTLKELRQIGLLHVLREAHGKDGKRPRNTDEIVSFELFLTQVTDVGLKELKDLKNLSELHLSEKITNAGLKELQEFKNLTKLHLNSKKITDAGLKELLELKNLSKLHLWNTSITDAGLKELPAFKSLSYLNLSQTKITDTGLKELQGLNHLLELDLANTKITDNGLKELKVLKNLSRLRISNTPITDQGLKELKELTNLSSIDLQNTKITLDGLKEVHVFKNLKELGISGKQITDGTLKTLRELGLLHAISGAEDKDDRRPKNLDEVVSLNLRYAEVTNSGLKELRDFKHLTDLNLEETKVTSEGLKELKRFKNLSKLRLESKQITDETLKELRLLGMLHLLAEAQAKEGKRPQNPSEVVTFSLNQTKVTDEGLKELHELKNLTELYLYSAGVTQAGVTELRRKLPKCKIYQ